MTVSAGADASASSNQLEDAENFADDFEIAERNFLVRMIRIVGYDLHPRRAGRAGPVRER